MRKLEKKNKRSNVDQIAPISSSTIMITYRDIGKTRNFGKWFLFYSEQSQFKTMCILSFIVFCLLQLGNVTYFKSWVLFFLQSSSTTIYVRFHCSFKDNDRFETG